MIDPLAEMVTLLQPQARYSKLVHGAGAWRVRRSERGEPFYIVVLAGACLLNEENAEPLVLEAGDFVLIPASRNFATSSVTPLMPADAESMPVMLAESEFRIGTPDGPADVQLLVGHCTFGSPDAALLVSLLPQRVHVRGDHRLTALVQLVVDESRARRPGREAILERLLEVLFIEALRATAQSGATPGLLRGLADERLAAAIRCMHEELTRPWTVAQLAQRAALSRSAFFDRFTRAVGVPPMEYLLAWRMAVAKDLLARETAVAQVAERIGYGSASAFSVAFSRHVGVSPARYARDVHQVPEAQAA